MSPVRYEQLPALESFGATWQWLSAEREKR
jgi:hypothetical protein